MNLIKVSTFYWNFEFDLYSEYENLDLHILIQSLCFRKFNFHARKLFHNRSLPPPHPRKTIFSYIYNASEKFLNLKNRRHLSYLNPLRTVLTTRMLIISINKEIRWNGKATKKEMSEKMFSACEALRFRHVVTQKRWQNLNSQTTASNEETLLRLSGVHSRHVTTDKSYTFLIPLYWWRITDMSKVQQLQPAILHANEIRAKAIIESRNI